MSAVRRRSVALLVALVAIGVAGWLVLRGRGAAVDPDVVRATGPTSDGPPAPLRAPELVAPSAARRPGATGEAATEKSIASDREDPERPIRETAVEFVDAATGLPVSGWALIELRSEPDAASTVPVIGRVPGAIDASSELLQVSLSRMNSITRSGLTVTRWCARGPVDSFIWDASPAVKGTARAVSFRTVQPVHRELDVRLTILDDDDRPIDAARVVSWAIGARNSPDPTIDRGSGGELRIRGVPWIAGAPLELKLGLPLTPYESAAAPLPGHDGAATWSTVLPESVPSPIRERIHPKRSGFNLAWYSCGGVIATDDTASTTFPGIGTVRVHVLDRKGQPLAGVTVRAPHCRKTTGDDGWAILDTVRAGPSEVTVLDPGYGIAPRSFVMKAAADNEVVLREAAGVTLDVVVVDGAGKPLPFAEVVGGPSPGATLFDFDDKGVQRLDPFTDVHGRRTFHRVPPGSLRLTATWGGLEGSVDVDLADGESRAVRLVVK